MRKRQQIQVVLIPVVAVAAVLVGRDVHLRQLNVRLKQAIRRHDWAYVRTYVLSGGRVVASPDREAVYEMAATSGDTEVMLKLIREKVGAGDADLRSSQLFDSIENHRTEQVQLLVKLDTDINRTRKQVSPLEVATLSGAEDIARILKEHGARYLASEALRHGDIGDIGYWFDHGLDPAKWPPATRQPSPLSIVCGEGRAEAVRMVLARSAGPDVYSLSTDSTGTSVLDTPLFVASRRGNLDAMRELISAGANVNMRSRSPAAFEPRASLKTGPAGNDVVAGTTPLIQAAEFGQAAAVGLLLKLGADVHATRPDGANALMRDLYFSDSTGEMPSIGYYTQKRLLPVPIDMQGMATRLKAPSQFGTAGVGARTTIAHLLIQSGIDVNAAGGVALREACANQYLEVVSDLLAHGAQVNVLTDSGQTPLMAAIQSGFRTSRANSLERRLASLKIAALLLEHGADPNGGNNAGVTALLLAARHNEPEAVKYLLEHHANIHAVDKAGNGFSSYALVGAKQMGVPADDRTALIAVMHTFGMHLNLMDSVHFGCLPDAAEALRHGANPNSTTVYPTSIQPVESSGIVQPQLTLKAQVNRINVRQIRVSGVTPLQVACACGYVDIVYLLLQHGAHIDTTDSRGWSPLMAAVAYNRAEILKLLLQKGADFRQRDVRQWTPLMIAASTGSVECVRALIAAGADINYRDPNGWTPLMRATSTGSIPCMEALMDSGADSKTKNSAGRGLVYIARYRNNQKVLKYLSDRGLVE